MTAAIRAGLTVTEFNELTPYELNLIIRGKDQAIRGQAQLDMSIAYIAARVVMAKNPPKLENLQKAFEEQKEQTPEDMLAFVKQLNLKLGGEEI